MVQICEVTMEEDMVILGPHQAGNLWQSLATLQEKQQCGQYRAKGQTVQGHENFPGLKHLLILAASVEQYTVCYALCECKREAV